MIESVSQFGDSFPLIDVDAIYSDTTSCNSEEWFQTEDPFTLLMKSFNDDTCDNGPENNEQTRVEESQPITDEFPPSLYVREPASQQKLYDILREKEIIKMASASNIARWKSYIDQVDQFRSFITPKQRSLMITTFNDTLRKACEGCAHIDIPTIIWVRSGVIHFYNEAFSRMTGWTASVPTPEMDMAMFQLIDPASIVWMWSAQMLLSNQKVKLAKKDVGFKRFDTEEKEYAMGTAFLTVKRDILDLPELNILHFIPNDACV